MTARWPRSACSASKPTTTRSTSRSAGMDDNVLWMVAGTGIYTVNVETGEAVMESELDGVEGAVRDIAILPAM